MGDGDDYIHAGIGTYRFHDDDESGLQLIDAGAGNDTIEGRDNLKVLGGEGNDTVYGGASYFDGGAGDDSITLPGGFMGEYKVDYLDGGEGTDTFTFSTTFGSNSFGSKTIGEAIVNFETINSQEEFPTFTLGAQAASAGESLTINVGTFARELTSLSPGNITFNGGDWD